MGVNLDRTEAYTLVLVSKSILTCTMAFVRRHVTGTCPDLKREDLARALAERSLLTREEAQDELDRVVHGVIQKLRRGGAAEMPGIGKLTSKPPIQGGVTDGWRSSFIPRSTKK